MTRPGFNPDDMVMLPRLVDPTMPTQADLRDLAIEPSTPEEMEMTADEILFAGRVRSILNEIDDMLVEKNRAYGNSALDPVRVFSKASTKEQILVRIDDKLSRLQRGNEFPGDDTIKDLIGYLVLLQMAD